MNIPEFNAQASLYRSGASYYQAGWASVGDAHLYLSQLTPLPNGGGPICKPIHGLCNIPAQPSDNCQCHWMRPGGTTCDPSTQCCTPQELTTTTPCSKNPTTGVCQSTTTDRCTSPPTVTTNQCKSTCGPCVGGSCGCDNYPTCAKTQGKATCTDACGDVSTQPC